jgi:hypothetical protein
VIDFLTRKMASPIALKDLAELLHAVAWPSVALVAVFVFRGAVHEILGRIPFDRASSLRVPGVAEVKLGPKPKELETARKIKIPAPPIPTQQGDTEPDKCE